MKPHDRQLFDDVFADATVVDIDLSRDDGEVALLVEAVDAVERYYFVRFLKVRSFAIDRPRPEVGGIFTLDAYEFAEANGELRIDLGRPGRDTSLRVRCQGVGLEPVDERIVEMVAPGRMLDDRTLIRPGVLAMAAAIRRELGARKGW
ncbi:MAG: hypothetical protein RIE77_01640 [Phycisphaerales bacterium]|jgi:hypothetical protein